MSRLAFCSQYISVRVARQIFTGKLTVDEGFEVGADEVGDVVGLEDGLEVRLGLRVGFRVAFGSLGSLDDFGFGVLPDFPSGFLFLAFLTANGAAALLDLFLLITKLIS